MWPCGRLSHQHVHYLLIGNNAGTDKAGASISPTQVCTARVPHERGGLLVAHMFCESTCVQICVCVCVCRSLCIYMS